MGSEHQHATSQLRENFDAKPPLSESVVKELFAQLYAPSQEAKIISKGELVRYRNVPVFIRGSRYGSSL